MYYADMTTKKYKTGKTIDKKGKYARISNAAYDLIKALGQRDGISFVAALDKKLGIKRPA